MTHVVGRYFRYRRQNHTRLVDLDWDNAIVLDACRYDLFAAVHSDCPLPGRLDRRRSAASGTPDYLTENFANDPFYDTVYVTANPYVNTELPTKTFHAVDPVWADGWDEELGTVRPEVVRNRALAAHDQYPDKRLIVHFNQPHSPFIGDDRIESRGMEAIRQVALGNEKPNPKDRQRTPFERLGAGEVSTEDVWMAYRSNLETAWDDVRELLEAFDGLTAVTADHGNALGERAWPFPVRVYGHPLGILIPVLTDVPWHTHQHGERKSVTADPPKESKIATHDATRRLRNLGYTT